MAPGIGKSSVPLVLEQIHAWARLSPDFAALSNGDRELSYAALCQRADRFAGYLAKLGVAPGDAVAICMERSFDWIVAALGILRAGAAYVPLDSAWPDARLRYSVHDAGAAVLVAREALLTRLKMDGLPVEVQGVDPCRDAALIGSAPDIKGSIEQNSQMQVQTALVINELIGVMNGANASLNAQQMQELAGQSKATQIMTYDATKATLVGP